MNAPDATSRCDACGNATAVARIQLTSSGALDFCRRCLLRSAPGLTGKIEDFALSPAAAELLVTESYVRGLLGVT